MAEGIATEPNYMNLVNPSVLKKKRVMLVRDLDVETVLASLKPFLQYTHIDTIHAERNRGTKTGALLDIIQRMSHGRCTIFNAFITVVAGTQPDLFRRLTGRAPSAEESDLCVKGYAEGLRECIQGQGHSTESPLDQRIDLDCEHVELTIVRDTVDSTAHTEMSDDALPSYMSRYAESGDNVPAVEVLTSETAEKPTRVLMTGRAGTGKSTTMQWLARQWSFNRWATDFTLVFFLQLRMLSLFDCRMTVIELLTLYSLYTVRDADLVRVVSSWLKTSGARLLIFIDGLDEVSGFTERCQMICNFEDKAHPIDLCLNIAQGNLLSTATVVAASRPFSSLTDVIHFQRHFEIIGLSESRVIEFVRRKHPSKAVNIEAVLRESPLMMSICGIAFYCALICSLIADGVIFKSADLQTYTRLISFIIVQLLSRKLTQWSFLIEVNPYFQKLAFLAYGGIFGRHLQNKMTQLVFNQYDIVQVELNSQHLRSLHQTGLLQTKTLSDGLRRDTFAEFFHFSIQELLASAYLLTHNSNTTSDLKQIFSEGQFNMAQMYLFGLRCDTESRWLNEVRFAVNPSVDVVSDIHDKYIHGLLQELRKQCQKKRQFTAKLRLCQLLNEGQMAVSAEKVAYIIAPNGKLTLENTPLTIIDLMAVMFVCQHVLRMSEIHLIDCSVNSTLLGFLASSMMGKYATTLHTLQLSHNKIDAEGAASIAMFLQEDYQLQTLDVGHNNMGDNGAEAIAEALQNNATLKTLVVGHNNIGDNGATAIAEALQYNTTLHTLNVVHNNINNSGATAIASALGNNTSLRVLNVNANNIGAYGAMAIAVALKKHSALRMVDVSYNKIHDTGIKALNAAKHWRLILRSEYQRKA